MKLLRNILIIFLAGLLLTACNQQQGQKTNTNTKALTKSDVEQIVHNYLLDNPQILVQVGEKLQKQRSQQMEQAAQDAIKNHSDDIFNNSNSLVVGNLHGNVTLVEFFDYQCVHCAHMFPVVQKLIEQNKNLRVVLKEFPIFGPTSQYAAMAVLAANQQGKAEQLHNAIFKSGLIEGKLTTAAVDKMAQKVGLNLKKLKADMQSKTVKTEVANNYKLAQLLGIQGTPAFIIAPTLGTGNGKTTFIPGASSIDQLQDAISKA